MKRQLFKGLRRWYILLPVAILFIVSIGLVSIAAVTSNMPSANRPMPSVDSLNIKVERATVKVPTPKGPGMPDIKGTTLEEAEVSLGFKPRLPSWLPQGNIRADALLLSGADSSGEYRVVLTQTYDIKDVNGTPKGSLSFAQSKRLRVRDVKIDEGRFTSTSFGYPQAIKNVRRISVGGAEGYYADDNSGESIIVWAKGGVGFSLSSMLLKEDELLKIAESVK